jgi:uncharacterized membrane protein
MKRIGVIAILLLAFFGLADSVYLAQHVESGTPLICTVVSGCNKVASSEYSRVFGIPLAELGVIFYAVLFIAAALECALYNRALRRVLQGLAIFGFLFSLYSTILQIFVIKAYCIYCLMSALITVFIFIIATMIEPIRKQRVEEETQPPRELSMPPAL